jgi:uncharacterized protein (DUF433 family)
VLGGAVRQHPVSEPSTPRKQFRYDPIKGSSKGDEDLEGDMYKEYVEMVEGGAYRVAGSRVSLDSVVYSFWNGESPETITQSFPTLTLEQVYGAIAFYLANQELIDEYIKQGEVDYEAKRKAAREADPMFYEKMAEARRRMHSQVR